jgi:hypothetical protein
MKMTVEEINWDSGEVEWDFPTHSINSFSQYKDFSIKTKSKNKSKIKIKNKSNILDKQKAIDTQSLMRDAVYSSLFKSCYEEITQMDSLMEKMSEAIQDSLSDSFVEMDMALLFFFFSLIQFNKISGFSLISLFKEPSSREKNIKTYKKIKKMTNLFVLVLFFILTKNIKNAE